MLAPGQSCTILKFTATSVDTASHGRGGGGGSPGTGGVYVHLFKVVSMSLAQEVPLLGNPYCPPHQPFQGIASQTDARASPEAQPAPTETGATKLGEKGLDPRLNYILHNLNIAEQGMLLVGIQLLTVCAEAMDGKGKHAEGHEARVHAPAQPHARALSFAGPGKGATGKGKGPHSQARQLCRFGSVKPASTWSQWPCSRLTATPCSARSPLSLDSSRVT